MTDEVSRTLEKMADAIAEIEYLRTALTEARAEIALFHDWRQDMRCKLKAAEARAAIAAACPGVLTGEAMVMSADELNLIRQWYNAAQDTNPEYLAGSDHALAARIAARPTAPEAQQDKPNE